MDVSEKYDKLETKQEDIKLLPTTSSIYPNEIQCTKPVDDEEIPLIPSAPDTMTVNQESRVEEIDSSIPGEISKPVENEEIASIAQSPNTIKVDQESQLKEEDSLPPTRVPETEGIDCSKPAEDEEVALIVQAPNINEVDQESQFKEEVSLPPTTVIESEGPASNTPVEDEKGAFTPDSIINMGDPKTRSEEEDADDSCSCCACCNNLRCFQSCLKWIMGTWIVKAVKRVIRLFTALWMWMDIGLDVNQTITYYHLIRGFEENGEYHDWALQYKEETTGTRLQTISPGYFYTACVVWIIPPVLDSFSSLAFEELSFPHVFNAIFRCNIDDIESRKKWFMYYPLELICSILIIYVVIPYAALKNGVKHLINGEVDENEELIGGINPKMLPLVKLFEIIGEALPQFILTLVFVCNNYPFLKDNDTYFGIPIPVSVISLMFSFGSLIMGVILGCQSGLKLADDDD